MTPSRITRLATLTALAALGAYATGLGLKPGLWEVRVVKQGGEAATAYASARRGHGATRVMHSESEMKYLGSDCGDVKPPAAPK
jgi:hypothetical protein